LENVWASHIPTQEEAKRAKVEAKVEAKKRAKRII
jgi:hypothetical protein